MSRAINPMIDSAFKALFATEANSHLLTSLLNAIVQPEVPIVSLEYLDPADEPDRPDGRRTIVDVKARDRTGHVYQVEVQVVLHPALPERMLLTWARLYNRQFKRGQKYTDLKPVTSIWILDRRLHTDGLVHRRVSLKDDGGTPLTSHCNLHILDLANFDVSMPDGLLENWLYFLKNARDWTELPPALDRGVMKEAMGVMKRFFEDDAQYYRYIAELDAETIELTLQQGIRDTRSQLEAAKGELAGTVELLTDKDELLADKDELLADKDELLADKDELLAKQARALADKDSELARLASLVQRLSNDP